MTNVSPPIDFSKWKSSDWSITINNPTEMDVEQIKNLTQYKWYRSFKNQFEEASTEHIQGHLKTEYIRFAAVKKALTRAHIEVAENKHALKNYVKKNDDTYKSEGIVVAEQCSIAAVYRSSATLWPSYDECLADYHQQDDDKLEEWKLEQLDKTVKRLIRAGMWGVEFIGANPQTRVCYKKYFLDMMYREYNAPSTPQPQGNTPQQEAQSEEQASLPESDG